MRLTTTVVLTMTVLEKSCHSGDGWQASYFLQVTQNDKVKNDLPWEVGGGTGHYIAKIAKANMYNYQSEFSLDTI